MLRFNKKAVFGLSLAGLSGLSMADVPAGVTTAITAAGTDATTVGAAIFVVLVGIFAIKLLKRVL